eukprot:TRINITY_DN5145_c0_g1_i2.p1 TRINITY_DN5145_c0_g1~~TRINITY_DN5145_c0_g1_i2.p1  ORF type:complete len:742 (+),score=230.48 TRINITY_DN5145_c0_g1_i2:128-2353(+)
MDDDFSDDNLDVSEEEEEIKLSRKRHRHKRQKKKKKSKKSGATGIEDMIEFDADENDEEEEEDYEAELSDAGAQRIEKTIIDQKRRRRYGIEDVIYGRADSDKYIRDLEEKNQIIEGNMISPDVSRQIILPSTKDPSLWFVKCKRGAERLACISLLNKAFAKARQKQPLLILSVTCFNHLKGYIYIEAYKEAHVRQAIEGLQCIGNKVTLVPQREMNEIYAVAQSKKKNLKRGDWVRVKSGVYAGDLGLVVEASAQAGRAKIKLVPRLETEETFAERPMPGKKRGKKSNTLVRPPQKLFNNLQYGCNEIKRDPQTGQEFYHWCEMDFRNGFLYKYFNAKQLKTEDVNPTLTELQLFKSSLSGEDEEDEKINLMLLKEKQTSGISKGDKVRVARGDLTDLKGTVISIDNALVTIEPSSDQVKHSLKFPVSDLEKYFEIGDFVRVTRGQNQGESGLVTAVEKGIVYIFSEGKLQEIEVRASDIQSGTDVRAEPTTKHNYRANDLVIFNNNKSAGIILKVAGDSVTVLDSYGDTKPLRIQDINSKRDSKHIPALDAMRNSISAGDSVRIIDGENKGKRGTIVHIYKDYVFLYSADQPGANGFFVEKRRNLLILGAEMLRGVHDASREKRAKARAVNPRRDDLYGKLVKIESGAYKGYQGIVTDVDKVNVKVELSSKPKVVNIDRGIVKLATEKAEEEVPIDHEVGTKTPAYFPQSPHWVASTPAPQSASYADPSKQFNWVDDNN